MHTSKHSIKRSTSTRDLNMQLPQSAFHTSNSAFYDIIFHSIQMAQTLQCSNNRCLGMFVCQAFSKYCIEICWLRAMEFWIEHFFFVCFFIDIGLLRLNYDRISRINSFIKLPCNGSSFISCGCCICSCFGYCVAIDAAATNKRRKKNLWQRNEKRKKMKI